MATSTPLTGKYRPRKGTHASLRARVDPEVHARVSRAAEAKGWSLSRYVEVLVLAQVSGMTVEQYVQYLAEQDPQQPVDGLGRTA